MRKTAVPPARLHHDMRRNYHPPRAWSHLDENGRLVEPHARAKVAAPVAATAVWVRRLRRAEAADVPVSSAFAPRAA